MDKSTYTILVADDEPNVRSLLSNILKSEGYNVITTENGHTALEIFKKVSPDLTLLDVRMPVLDGIEAFKLIRQENSDALVIMITAYGTIETAVQAMKMGAFDYLVKPFNLEEIKVIIRKSLEMRKISAELTVLRQEFMCKENLVSIVLSSSVMKDILHLANIVCKNDTTILLRGESGTGKDLLARYIHAHSHRSERPFVKIHCGALPETLIESELFGYEKGAFTGATSRKQGKIELAQGGTLFLDEIGEITPQVQVKLLRILQDREFERLGGNETIKTNARFIAATNKNLEDAMERKEFREDLFYRLNIFPLQIPPLRERKEAIPLLAEHFVQRFCTELNRPPLTIDDETMSLLLLYDWPGNIRELENIIERAVILTPGDTITSQVLPHSIIKYNNNTPKIFSTPVADRSLKDVMSDIEKEIIKKMLLETGGNRSKAADKLGISRRALHYKLVEYKLAEEE